MKSKLRAIATATLLALAVGSANAQQVVGYNRVTVPANSDARLTVPFNQAIEGTFAVTAKSGATLTVSATLTANQYASAYYVRFISGNASGLWATISNNAVNSITLADTAVANLVSAGDTFRVYKHHTLGSLFPKGMCGVSHVAGTKILIYANNLASTQNRSASKTATYNGTTYKWSGSGISDATILVPETQFIVRNLAAAPLTVTFAGTVADYSVSLLVAPSSDQLIGSGYPVPVVLKHSGLGGVNQRKVLFYNNAAIGQNKSAIKTATYSTTTSKWGGAGVTGDEIIAPSEVINFRLPAGEVLGTKVTLVKPY